MKRQQLAKVLRDSPEKVWDVLVIGGGATGLGAGVDAASRGFETLLLEQHDFAKGTSSRSTKLVHGGVRYLAQGDISLVLEALEERGLLRQNAPHLFKNLKFIIPSYEWWGGPFYTVGMKVYDMMSRNLGLGPSEYLSREETMAVIPNLVEDQLKGGVVYHDGQFDDSRLAINLAQTMVENSGIPINYFKVTGLLKDDDGTICGVHAIDQESGEQYTIRAKAVINATGIWVDDVLRMDALEHHNTIVPSQGVHLVLDRKFLKGDAAIMIPKTSDGRVLFAVPWHGKVIVGTTDTRMQAPDLEPRALDEEIEFILTTAADYLQKAPTRADVKSVFAGMRPLAAPEEGKEDTREISRGHKITISLSGLVTISGGKWTTYRRMAQDVIDKTIILAGLERMPCVTQNMAIHGYVKNVDRSDHLYVYGSDIPKVKYLVNETPELGKRLHADLPYIKAEVIWAVRHEMARTVEDVLARRTRALFLDARASLDMAEETAALMAAELGHDAGWAQQQVDAFRQVATGYVLEA